MELIGLHTLQGITIHRRHNKKIYKEILSILKSMKESSYIWIDIINGVKMSWDSIDIWIPETWNQFKLLIPKIPYRLVNTYDELY